jgi:hypothetical protein
MAHQRECAVVHLKCLQSSINENYKKAANTAPKLPS